MSKPRLILRDLRHPGLPEGSYELNRSPIRIGRGPRCEIRLHSDHIADVQVILRHESDRWTLHPVGPAEGCIIHDGYLSESARLDHGTRFRIGHVEMMLSTGLTSDLSFDTPRSNDTRIAPESTIEPLAHHVEPFVQAQPVSEPEPTRPLPVAAPVPVPELTNIYKNIVERYASEPITAAVDPVLSDSDTEAVHIENVPVEIPAAPVVEHTATIERSSERVEAISALPEVDIPAPIEAPEQLPRIAPVPPLQAPHQTGSVFSDSMVFTDLDTKTKHPKRAAHVPNLEIGSLGSAVPTVAKGVFGAISGSGHLAASIAPSAIVPPSVPRASRPQSIVRPVGVNEIASDSAFGVDSSRAATRKTGRVQRDQEVSQDGFIAPIGPSRNRAMPLRRFLRDHDSSNLFDGKLHETQEIKAEALPEIDSRITPEINSAESIQESLRVVLTPLPEISAEPSVPAVVHEPIEPAIALPDSLSGEQAIEALSEAPQAVEEPAFVEPDQELAGESDPVAPLHSTFESPIQEFESWLESVGENLEPIESIPADFSVTDSAEAAHASPQADERIEPVFEQAPEIPAERQWTRPVEFAENPEIDRFEMKAGLDPAPAQTEPSENEFEEELRTATTAIAETQVEAHAEASFEVPRRGGIDPKVEESLRKVDVHEWPSAQDILKWSADRHGRSFLLASSEDLKMLGVSPDKTRPREWMRMNFPSALVLSLAWLGGVSALTMVGYRMSAQDELTQKSINAVLAAETSGTSPRLDPASMDKLTRSASWWEVPPVQRWFRATFVRMREEKGQPLAVPSTEIAAEVARLDPLYPPVRLWKKTSAENGTSESVMDGLSLDVLPLVMQADEDRRRGNSEKANGIDRIALKLASDSGKPARDEEFVYDAEFGTKRFMLPGQKRILAILKRLAKETDPESTLNAVMPDDSPLVWLTAAQLIRHSGLGDAEPFAKRVTEWQIPAKLTGEQRQLIELAKAEASSLLGDDDIAIETYERLIRELPDSEWKRTLYLNLGMLNLKSLKTEAARLALKKARGEDPYHEIDRHAIATIRGLSNSGTESMRTSATLRAN